MKKSTFRRQVVLVVWMLLCGLSAQAADEDLITQQITINALEAGTLPQRISSSKKNLITNLKIIGEINGTDLKFIRDVELKKVHPCGINEWEILRVGMDFRLKCVGCGRQVMVPRKMVEKNFRGFIKKACQD